MKLKATVFAAGLIALANAAAAQDAQECTNVGVEDFFDLDEAQVIDVYNCLEGKMAEGYAKEGDEVGSSFRDWTVTATRAAVQGTHGGRLLLTYANDVAADSYMAYAEENEMPVGSVLAKESISLSKKKKTARPGPLFIMTKMEAGSIPETDDWLYGGLQPNGKPMKFKQAFCHDCHSGWAEQDNLAYPVEEVRISSGG